MRLERINPFEFLFFFLFSFSALAFNTLGFDFYHHVVVNSNFESLTASQSGWSLLGIGIPRYLMGEHILYLLTLGVVPLGWVVVFINAYFFMRIMCHSFLLLGSFSLIVFLIASYNVVFMSMMSLGFLALWSAYLRYRLGKPYWFYLALGASFHPLTCIGSFMALLFRSDRLKNSLAPLLVLVLSVIVSYASDENSKEILDRLEDLIYITWTRSYFLLVVLAFFVLFRKIKQRIFYLRVPKNTSYGLLGIGFFSILMLSYSAQIERGSFFVYLTEQIDADEISYVHKQKNLLICAAWISRSCYEHINVKDILWVRSSSY